MVATPVGIVMPLALSRGGCEVQLFNLLWANLAGPKVDYRVCFLERGPMVDQVRAMGYDAVVIAAGRMREPHRYLIAVVRLAMWIRKNRLGYVISWMEKAHLYACPAVMVTRTPTGWWLRSIDPGGVMLRFIDRLPADSRFACSRAAADALRPGPSGPERIVCYSAVNLNRYDPDALPAPAEARRRLGLPPDRPVVGLVARLQRWKGIDVFIDAAAHLADASPRPLLVVVGGEHKLEPGVRVRAEQRLARMGLADHVRLVGYQADVPTWMQACDVVVHASITPEPLGIVIVEAMALGKRVVATAAGGPLEIITDGVDGRLVPPGEPRSLAGAIADPLPDTPANVDLGHRARARAGHFSARAGWPTNSPLCSPACSAGAARIRPDAEPAIARVEGDPPPGRVPPVTRI